MSVVSYNTGSSSYIPSVPNGSGGSSLMKHEGEVFQVSWFTNFNYAIRSSYSSNVNDVMPSTGPQINSHIRIRSSVPNIARVDWGDGNMEQFYFSKLSENSYVLYFRSYYDTRLNGRGGVWGIGSDGEEISTVPPHHYLDDEIKLRQINVEFSDPITSFYSTTCVMPRFPIIVSSALNEFVILGALNIESIPFDSFKYIQNLITLQLSNALSSPLSVVPQSLFSLSKLENLNVSYSFDLSDIESSGIRGISSLASLEGLNLESCRLRKYITEFNDLHSLRRLEISVNNIDEAGSEENLNYYPDMSEVSSINQNLTVFDFMGSYNCQRSEWPTSISGKGLQNLTELNISECRVIRVDNLPDWIYEMRSLDIIRVDYLFDTQVRVDTFVDTFYQFVTSWDLITMDSLAADGNTNQFYSLSVTTYQSAYPTRSTRPSGEYQAPSGFELGVSNGIPQTPMEKIYVLENNYKQKWIIKPEN